MIKTMLRDLIRDTPVLYRIYIKKRLGRELRLPRRDTTLVLEGYPRSGNTFARYHLEAVFPSLRFSSHVHTLAALKRARKLGIYTVILIRDPREAVASFCCKYAIDQHDRVGIAGAVKDYLHFYRYVQKYSNDFDIVCFDGLIASPIDFLEHVGGRLRESVKREYLACMSAKAKAKMLAREPQKDARGSSLPSAERAISKQILYSSIEQSSDYSEVEELYQTLMREMTP
tara:strand:- start:7582 stop:8268 length:687 start_codon:yes stop_codon:yes gene_type:complete